MVTAPQRLISREHLLYIISVRLASLLVCVIFLIDASFKMIANRRGRDDHEEAEKHRLYSLAGKFCICIHLSSVDPDLQASMELIYFDTVDVYQN